MNVKILTTKPSNVGGYHPVSAKKDNRELLDGRWDKNDTKDSANVADLVGQSKRQFYEQPGCTMIAGTDSSLYVRHVTTDSADSNHGHGG